MMTDGACLAFLIAIILILYCLKNFKSQKEHYGAANELHAGLNRSMRLDEVPGHGWPSFHLSGYRADSASAISHMSLRD